MYDFFFDKSPSCILSNLRKIAKYRSKNTIFEFLSHRSSGFFREKMNAIFFLWKTLTGCGRIKFLIWSFSTDISFFFFEDSTVYMMTIYQKKHNKSFFLDGTFAFLENIPSLPPKLPYPIVCVCVWRIWLRGSILACLPPGILPLFLREETGWVGRALGG